MVVDYRSVLLAAESLEEMGRKLAGAPGEQGLRRVVAALPGERLAAAATSEADEWRLEVDEVTAGLKRSSSTVSAAVTTFRELDQRLAQ